MKGGGPSSGVWRPLTTGLTAATRELFRVAHVEYDLYFRGFLHNHLSHGLVSLASMTTTDEEMTAHYQAQIGMLVKRCEPLSSVGTVTADNWHDCLDVAGVKASGNFLDFFDEELSTSSLSASDDDDNDDKFRAAVVKYALNPRIVSRLLGGAVHPLIDLGYACELAKSEPETGRLLLIKALAMQCTTRDQFGAAVASLRPLSEVRETQTPLRDDKNRVLHVLDLMRQDEALTDVPEADNPDKTDYTISRTDVMGKYYNMFSVEETHEGVQTAYEHLFFGALAIVFASVPKTQPQARLDFFLAHLLTSVVSVRQVLPFLDCESAAALCRFHFVATLAWYRARGHPSIDVEYLMTQPADCTWEECERRLRADPALEVHAIKVLRALQMGRNEDWAVQALGRGLVMPGADEKVWLICANLLVRNIREKQIEGVFGTFMWLGMNEAWEYYNSP